MSDLQPLVSELRYPDGLPGPTRWDMQGRERRARSEIEGKPGTRGRWRERVLDVEAEWIYTAAQMAIWKPWYDDTLENGLFRFTMRLPGRGGWVDRVLRYRTKSLRTVRISMGATAGLGGTPGPVFRVSVTVEVRATSPQLSPSPMRWVNAEAWDNSVPAKYSGTISGSNASLNVTTLTPPAASAAVIQSSRQVSGGKRYVEVNFINEATSAAHEVGWLMIRKTDDDSAFGLSYSGGLVSEINGTPIGTPSPTFSGGAWFTGYVIGFALDTTTGELWIRRNGSWGGVSGGGTPDPAAGVAGIPSGIIGGSLLIQLGYWLDNYANVTAKLTTDAESMAYAPPAGFVAWQNELE